MPKPEGQPSEVGPFWTPLEELPETKHITMKCISLNKDNNLLLGAVLGDGGFSVVQKGFIRDKTDKTESDDNEGVVAVKRIPFAPESLPRNIRMLQHKVSIKLEPYYERKLKYHGEAYLLKEKIKSKCSLMGRSIA